MTYPQQNLELAPRAARNVFDSSEMIGREILVHGRGLPHSHSPSTGMSLSLTWIRSQLLLDCACLCLGTLATILTPMDSLPQVCLFGAADIHVRCLAVYRIAISPLTGIFFNLRLILSQHLLDCSSICIRAPAAKCYR